MGAEHAPELVWQAQELYCSERLPFTRIAERLGVADSTLRRWADQYGWRETREEIAKVEAEIRVDKVLARSKVIKALLVNPRSDLAFAVSSLESQTLKEAEFARKNAEHEELQRVGQGSGQGIGQNFGQSASQDENPPLRLTTSAEVVAALRLAVEKKLALLLSRPEHVDLKSVQEVQKCLKLITEMEASQPKTDKPDAKKGVPADVTRLLYEALGVAPS